MTGDAEQAKAAGGKSKSADTTVSEKLAKSSAEVKDRFESLKAFLLALGDDVQLKTLLFYFAFKRIKNFASVEVHPQTGKIVVFVKVDFKDVHLEEGFTRDVRKVGHFGTGDLEITIGSDDELERAKPLIVKSYEEN
jgi:predicted transport protein